MIFALHPNIDVNKINNICNTIDIKVNNFGLSYGEKFLLYNVLANAYVKDLVATIKK